VLIVRTGVVEADLISRDVALDGGEQGLISPSWRGVAKARSAAAAETSVDQLAPQCAALRDAHLNSFQPRNGGHGGVRMHRRRRISKAMKSVAASRFLRGLHRPRRSRLSV
jgi:hypothetical protein